MASRSRTRLQPAEGISGNAGVGIFFISRLPIPGLLLDGPVQERQGIGFVVINRTMPTRTDGAITSGPALPLPVAFLIVPTGTPLVRGSGARTTP